MKRKVITMFVLTLVAMVTIGCCSGENVFTRSYMQEYILYDGIKVRRELAVTKNLDLYVTPTYRVNYQSEGNDKTLYDNICKENGDTCYNREIFNPVGRPTVMTAYPHFTTINVYSNKDFDAQHPAGTPLNDVITVSYRSPLAFIESGYSEADTTRYYPTIKLLSELGSDDLRMNLDNIFLCFVKDPDVISTHMLTFETINAEGKRYKTTYNYDFSLEAGEFEPEITITSEKP